MNPRILAFIIMWILTPKGSNHDVLTKEYLLLMYCFMKKIPGYIVVILHCSEFDLCVCSEFKIVLDCTR